MRRASSGNFAFDRWAHLYKGWRAVARAERREREAAMLTGNPLLADVSDGGGADFSVKRRWGDDAIFKNQARDEPKHATKRFINDTVRNDFHRKFLKRYIR